MSADGTEPGGSFEQIVGYGGIVPVPRLAPSIQA